MPIPQNKTLQTLCEEEVATDKSSVFVSDVKGCDKNVIIKPVKCHNNYVAILLSTIESTIELPGTDGQFKNEGLVIGVGPGIADGNGGRLAPTVNLGDYVMIGARNHVATLVPDSGHYKGQKVVIVVENNIICDVPTDIKFTVEE